MMNRTRFEAMFCAAAIVASALIFLPTAAPAQQDALDPERRAQLQRQAGGLRVGPWWPAGLNESANANYSRLPMFEGYFQRGLDRHLALESTVSVWRRQREANDATGGRVNAYVVPLYTSLKLYPTRPTDTFEPFVSAGIGFAFGIEDREAGSGLLGVQGGTNVVTGFGFRGGGGMEWRFSGPFGLALGAAYQWIRFGDSLDGERRYAGLQATGGLVYRFQFD